jgi:UDP-N-acetylmuramyl pentapeptide synthase
MVRTLAEARDKVKRRIVIAGEMLELGPESPQMHREAGTRLLAWELIYCGECAASRRI